MEIIKYPSATLRIKSKRIEIVTEEIKLLALNMLKVMHEFEGIGLAAPQIGKNICLIVVDIGSPIVMINPKKRITIRIDESTCLVE